jgi:hypothetical protein
MIFRRIQGATLVAFGLVVGSVGGCSNGSSADPVASVGCSGLQKPSNEEFCPTNKPALDCTTVKANSFDGCGVPVQIIGTNTTTEVQRSSTVKEFGGMGPVDLSCFDKATWPKADSSQTVEITGYVRNFSNGCDVVGTQIEIFPVKRTGGADDGTLGARIGDPVIIADQPCSDATPDVCQLVVVDGKCDSSNPRRWRKFSYKGVPSETELVIKTGPSASASGYTTLYDYNIYVKDSDIKNGQWEHDVRAIIQSDYTLIPTVAFGSTIASGNGAIAGEVHDCGEVRVSGAIVNVSARHSVPVGYFTENENAPLPDANKNSTSSLGLYAAYDLAPGPARISAVGTVGGKVVSLGYYDVQVFPNAITAMTFRGLRPFQAANAAGN